MNTKSNQEKDDDAQSLRFLEAARIAEGAEADDVFRKALMAVIAKKKTEEGLSPETKKPGT